jgi:hypothetical protein
MSGPNLIINRPNLSLDIPYLTRGDLQVRQRPDLTHCRVVGVDIEYKSPILGTPPGTANVTFKVIAVSINHRQMLQKRVSMSVGIVSTLKFDFSEFPEFRDPAVGGGENIENLYLVFADQDRQVAERDESNNGLLATGSCVT